MRFPKTTNPPAFRPAESLTAGFSTLLIAVVLYHHSAIPSASRLVLIYASVILLQYVLVKVGGLNAFLGLTRDIIFPVVAVLIIFDSLGLFVHAVNPADIDYLLIQMDYRLFGTHPTVFLERYTTPLLTDLLQVAYTTYYFMPVALGVYVRLKRGDDAFSRTLFLILLCFYLSYVGYLLFPALGPRYAMDHLHEGPVGGFLVGEPIQKVLNLLEGVKRDAFPSGHTAVALTVLYLARRLARPLFRIFAPCTALMMAATVYCRYHYVVDVIAGVLLAVVAVAAGEVYYSFWKRSRHGDPPQAGC